MHAATQYRPLVLKLVSIPGLGNPVALVLAALIVSLPLFLVFNVSALTLLTMASNLGVTSFLHHRHRHYLDQLRPALQVENSDFDILLHGLNRFSRPAFIAVALLAPLIFVAANWWNPRLHELLSGKNVDASMIISLICALLAWVIFSQTTLLVIVRSHFFRMVGKHNVEVDLLDTGQLAPFMKVGLSTFLVFICAYTLLPIGVLQRPDSLLIVAIGIALSLPVAVAALLAPALSVRGSIRLEKSRELSLVNRALKGDRACLDKSVLAAEASAVSVSNLLFYRSWLENLSDWPIDSSVSRRLGSYLIIPLLSWVAAFMFEQWIQDYLNLG